MEAAAYARYSTDNQTNNSIAYQMLRIGEYAAKHGIQIVAEYADEAETGTNTDRIGFRNMMRDAAGGRFGAVIIYDITRGSRDVGDWFTFRKTMMLLDVEVISVENKLGNMLDPNDFLVELMNVGIGQHHVLTSRQKSRDGVVTKAKQSLFLGGIPPLGYDIVDGKYIVNEVEAQWVKIIFEMYSTGSTFDQIVDALDRVHARGKKGRPIGKNGLHDILKNERYIGNYSWNKLQNKIMGKWVGKPNPNIVRVPGGCPQIVDNATWERVKAKMAINKRSGNKAKREYLLTGLIECESCGATYVAQTRVTKYGTYTYYTCGNKQRSHTCKAKNIHANVIEPFVVDHIKNFLLTLDYNETALIIAKAINGASPNLSAEKKELAEITGKISNGVQALMKGYDFPELHDEIDSLRVRKEELEEILSSHEKARRWVNPKKIADMLKQSAVRLDDSKNLKSVIRDHITRIFAHADGSFTVNIGLLFTDGSGASTPIVYKTFFFQAA